VNRVHGRRFAPDILAKLGDAPAAGEERALLRAVAERAVEETSWAEINAQHLERLREAIREPLIVLPYLFTEEFGEAEMAELAGRLQEAAASRAGLR
jgi:hypothetical protein